PPEQVWARAQEAAGGRDMNDRHSDEGGRARQEPEREAEGDAGERGRERVGPRPAETVIKDVGGGAHGKSDRRPERDAEAALDEAPEEGLLDGAVEGIEAGLERGVVR